MVFGARARGRGLLFQHSYLISLLTHLTSPVAYRICFCRMFATAESVPYVSIRLCWHLIIGRSTVASSHTFESMPQHRL